MNWTGAPAAEPLAFRVLPSLSVIATEGSEHFRAFKLANDAWQEHIRQNAKSGARTGRSPAGAVLDDDRD